MSASSSMLNLLSSDYHNKCTCSPCRFLHLPLFSMFITVVWKNLTLLSEITSWSKQPAHCCKIIHQKKFVVKSWLVFSLLALVRYSGIIALNIKHILRYVNVRRKSERWLIKNHVEIKHILKWETSALIKRNMHTISGAWALCTTICNMKQIGRHRICGLQYHAVFLLKSPLASGRRRMQKSHMNWKNPWGCGNHWKVLTEYWGTGSHAKAPSQKNHCWLCSLESQHT